LLDSNYLHVTAWWDAFRERGHDVACADIHRALGLSSDDLISRVLGEPDRLTSSAIGALSGSRREPSPGQPAGAPAARR
jgi:hypothetical protein